MISLQTSACWFSVCALSLSFISSFHLFRVVAELKDFPSVRNASKWCPEDGYDNVDDTEIYPYRAFGLGRRESFRIMLKVLNRDIDYLCGSGFNGYKITFHLPNELPPMWKKRYHVSAEQAGFFLVAAKLVLTSPALRNYAPAVRQCYFNTERNLRYFHGLLTHISK